MRKAWQMVEQAQTPEVKRKLQSDSEWTMLDENYQDRTRRTFSSGPVLFQSGGHVIHLPIVKGWRQCEHNRTAYHPPLYDR